MFRAGVCLAGLIAIFALTRPADAYDFGATVEAMAMAKHLQEEFKKDAPEATSSWSSKDVALCQGFSEVTAGGESGELFRECLSIMESEFVSGEGYR
jgi:hypothetical protein